MEIRKPTNDEMERLYQAMPEAYFESVTVDVSISNEQIINNARKGHDDTTVYLTLFDGSEILGWVMIGDQQENYTNSKFGYIYEIFIFKGYRGKGYARKLMERAIHDLKARGHQEIRLNVYAGNEARKLYEAFGFKDRQIIMSLDC
ncbi:GNAT family N-acetyltransferase [Staphylococcus massiliensis]|uniref:N-acetyltransferase GCN5 n=1 Tax=Staphylococcus massiliensis S46 TaxID=1229783 RepID=K9AY26_9STAP|nr:GNAT family N-acetyltransferase [Staphylococcus massiliensis]EKU47452.1 N-acetyltransferase GCN5 [Staphylococcus massiliensis S46]MCG3400368.1 GNAT family N-acetyltransferase [Staphylococcus massiliensis]MCG3401939.1 GNAT family N-acetyltransferase [Staphylococcus massiliensis]MCG3412398.1 GNAT family N-acetyltransferase [Staphylococcus massiliensis]POA01445.1 N-acetyltransferase [Staphylococcus massiliensis CCUG 55927]